MQNIVAVEFQKAGRLFDFTVGDLICRIGDKVVVETERGQTVGRVVSLRFEDQYKPGELTKILRLASEKDRSTEFRLSQEEILRVARERSQRFGLKMHILSAEVLFAGSKIALYFSANGRVDFRDLVKDLASHLKTRVELRQVGARDEAKLVGGVGICGREFCCSSFLREFVPVSIKMAKNQNLALNPHKVSGGCGRLLCCLTYENDVYTEMRQKMPPLGSKVRLIEENLEGVIRKSDIINQLFTVQTADGKILMVKVSQVEVLEKAQDFDRSEAESWGEDIDLKALED